MGYAVIILLQINGLIVTIAEIVVEWKKMRKVMNN